MSGDATNKACRFTRSGISLETAVSEAVSHLGTSSANGSPVAVHALAMTPREARIAAVSGDGTVTIETGARWVGFEGSFEARFFSEIGELSWRRDGDKGRALLTLDRARTLSEGWRDATPPGFERLTESQRLVWGELDGKIGEGWSGLSSPRVGRIAVPLSCEGAPSLEGRRVVLRVHEYSRIVEDGNVVAAGERLVGLDWLTGSDGGNRNG